MVILGQLQACALMPICGRLGCHHGCGSICSSSSSGEGAGGNPAVVEAARRFLHSTARGTGLGAAHGRARHLCGVLIVPVVQDELEKVPGERNEGERGCCPGGREAEGQVGEAPVVATEAGRLLVSC